MKLPALCSTSLLALSLIFINPGISHAEAERSAITAEQRQAAQRFSQIPRGVPIVMLNMLKFRELASYPDGNRDISGQEAYEQYRKAASKLVAEIGGSTVWAGDAKAAVIAPAKEHWDEVFLVRYPSLEAFLSMINSEAYQAVVFHRTAALEDSRLIATVEKKNR